MQSASTLTKKKAIYLHKLPPADDEDDSRLPRSSPDVIGSGKQLAATSHRDTTAGNIGARALRQVGVLRHKAARVSVALVAARGARRALGLGLAAVAGRRALALAAHVGAPSPGREVAVVERRVARAGVAASAVVLGVGSVSAHRALGPGTFGTVGEARAPLAGRLVLVRGGGLRRGRSNEHHRHKGDEESTRSHVSCCVARAKLTKICRVRQGAEEERRCKQSAQTMTGAHSVFLLENVLTQVLRGNV